MKFIVSSSALLKRLSQVSGVIATNPMVPILENFLFEIIDGELKITASDLHISMSTSIDVESKENGNIAVPAKILLDTLKNLPEQPVTFSIDENTFGIEISADAGKYKLSGESAADFPKLPVIDNEESINMSSDILATAISNTLIAVSNDDIRPAMTGVYVKFTGEHTLFVSTDGHRLVKYVREDIQVDTESSIIIPKKALQLLKSSLPSENSNVIVNYNTAHVHFSFGSISLICRLIDERFPDYSNVIPQDNTNKVGISREALLSSLKRSAIYANKTTHQVRFQIIGSEIQISAEDIDFSNEAVEQLQCEHDGSDIEIGFNARFLIEMLNNITSDNITLTLSEPNRAGLIYPQDLGESEDLLLLVMPVMLSNPVAATPN